MSTLHSSMTTLERRELSGMLEHDLERLDIELQILEEALRPIAPECALGDLARFELMHDQEVMHNSYLQLKKERNRLLYAQSHIDDEAFGLCQDCEMPIAYERLKIMPGACYCVDCAKERENDQQR